MLRCARLTTRARARTHLASTCKHAHICTDALARTCMHAPACTHIHACTCMHALCAHIHACTDTTYPRVQILPGVAGEGVPHGPSSIRYPAGWEAMQANPNVTARTLVTSVSIHLDVRLLIYVQTTYHVACTQMHMHAQAHIHRRMHVHRYARMHVRTLARTHAPTHHARTCRRRARRGSRCTAA